MSIQQGFPFGAQERIWKILERLEPWRDQSQRRKRDYWSRSKMEPQVPARHRDRGRAVGSGKAEHLIHCARSGWWPCPEPFPQCYRGANGDKRVDEATPRSGRGHQRGSASILWASGPKPEPALPHPFTRDGADECLNNGWGQETQEQSGGAWMLKTGYPRLRGARAGQLPQTVRGELRG